MKRFFVIIFIVLAISSVFSKTKQNDENRFQFGIGLGAGTSNILSFIDSVKMSQDENYFLHSYPYFKDVPSSELQNIRRTISIANILCALDYNASIRLMGSAFMSEAVISFIPVESTATGRFDMLLSVNAGVRAPFWIMPYILAGVNFTFSWYPGKVADYENWKTNAGYGIVDNFCWRPGVNLKLGLDIKGKNISVGAYYQYMIKDFNEFGGYMTTLRDKFYYDGVDDAANYSLGLVLASQSKFGVAIVLYPW